MKKKKSTGEINYILQEKRMASLCVRRLNQERIHFKKHRPYGTFARCGKKENGAQDITTWHCGIKTRAVGPWHGAVLRMRLEFPEDYPARPPKMRDGEVDARRRR